MYIYSKIRKTYNNQGLSIGEVCGQQVGVHLGSVYKPWGDSHLKGLGMLVVKDCGLTCGVHDKTLLVLAVKVSLGVHSKKQLQ